ETVPTPTELPLTGMQQAYLLGRSSAYELGGIGTYGYVEVDCADLDVVRLRQAWRRVVDRHEMLRAEIRPDGSQVLTGSGPEITVHDWREAPGLDARLTELR